MARRGAIDEPRVGGTQPDRHDPESAALRVRRSAALASTWRRLRRRVGRPGPPDAWRCASVLGPEASQDSRSGPTRTARASGGRSDRCSNYSILQVASQRMARCLLADGRCGRLGEHCPARSSASLVPSAGSSAPNTQEASVSSSSRARTPSSRPRPSRSTCSAPRRGHRPEAPRRGRVGAADPPRVLGIYQWPLALPVWQERGARRARALAACRSGKRRHADPHRRRVRRGGRPVGALRRSARARRRCGHAPARLARAARVLRVGDRPPGRARLAPRRAARSTSTCGAWSSSSARSAPACPWTSGATSRRGSRSAAPSR